MEIVWRTLVINDGRASIVTSSRVSRSGRLPIFWIASFSTVWLGLWTAELTTFQLLLPQQINSSLAIDAGNRHSWLRSVIDFGIITALSSLCAFVAFPVTGALSDHTKGSFGRRRPWILGGAILCCLSLVMLGSQHGTVGLAIWWCSTVVGFCITGAALTAMIGDQVPHRQRGVVSGLVSAPQAPGLLIGISLVSVLMLSEASAYALIAALLFICIIPFLLVAEYPPVLEGPAKEERSLRDIFSDRDFRWVTAGRFLINLGVVFGTCLLAYYIQFRLDVTDMPPTLLAVTAVYMLFLTVFATACGWLSDKIDRRKPFATVAAALQVVAAGVLITTGSVPG